MKRAVEIEAAEALLDIGVSLPFFRLPLMKRPIRLMMRRPCLGGLIRISKLYLQMGITYKQMEEFDKDEELQFIAMHGGRISRMVALTVCRGAVSGTLFARPLAWLIRWFVPNDYLQAANRQFITLLGTRSFMSIIDSVETANPMKPRTSQRNAKGS
ncbi:hypothetical protein [Alistipes sp.]|uniref:hypothetical protein n=1 Tax=Alistipes sp. TaxID=1872444 RepID=UPI003AF0187D